MYDLERDANGDDVLRAVPGSGLGILRNPPGAGSGTAAGAVSDRFARLPAAIRAKARERTLLVLTKANRALDRAPPDVPRLRRREALRRRTAT